MHLQRLKGGVGLRLRARTPTLISSIRPPAASIPRVSPRRIDSEVAQEHTLPFRRVIRLVVVREFNLKSTDVLFIKGKKLSDAFIKALRVFRERAFRSLASRGEPLAAQHRSTVAGIRAHDQFFGAKDANRCAPRRLEVTSRPGRWTPHCPPPQRGSGRALCSPTSSLDR